MGNIEFNFIQLLILFGAMQGFIFSSVVFLTKKHRNTPILYMGLTVFVLSFTNMNHILFDVNSKSALVLALSELYLPWQWLVAPFLYCFINSYYGNKQLSTQKIIFLFVPFFIVFILHIMQYAYKSFYNANLIIPPYYKSGLFLYTNIASFIHTPSVIYLMYQMILNYEIKHKNQILEEKINWIKNTIQAGFGICGIAIFSIIIILIYEPDSSFIAYPFFICISLWIYWIGYASLNKSKLLEETLPKIKTIASKPAIKTGYNTYCKINKNIKTEKLYLDSNLSLNTVSQKYDISSGYLSQLINQHSKKNFNDYINELRINEAKLMLLDTNYSNYTIDAIALECGFKSKSNFYTLFKKFTQQTPNQFKKSQIITSESSTS